MDDLCAGVGESDEALIGAVAVTAAELPWAYRELLAHHGHMTRKLSAYHGGPPTLEVLEHRHEGDVYSRKIVLRAPGSGAVVEFGIVRLDLSCTSDEVREAILERKTPLGDIMTRFDVMTRVEPKWFLHFQPAGVLARYFGELAGDVLYGRIGMIYFHDQPAMELLEIVTDRRATQIS